MMMKSGWGNYPKIKSKVLKIESLQELQLVVRENDKILAFGNNLSYGDSSLSTVSIDMKKLNGILSFDSQEGILKVEAGTSLKKVLELIVPFGWFVLVTPGTKYVTVGGMIASIVHGKNHHKKGSFGIRIENLVYVNKIKKRLFFENLTLAPIEKELINFKLLNENEKDYLFKYHLKVYTTYSKFLNLNERKWLASLI